MSRPFGSYKSVAADLMHGAALTMSGGELDALVSAHPSEEVAEFFGVEDPQRARHRRRRLLQAMVQVITDYDDRRMEAPLRQSAVVEETFVFAFRDDPDDTPARRERDGRLRCRPALQANLYRLGDDEFERLCGQLLVVVGCTTVAVTRQNKDRGIDFLGRLPVEPAREPPGARRLALGLVQLFIVGQAKRYRPESLVAADEIRNIVGTWRITMQAHVSGSLPAHLQDTLRRVGLRGDDPILYMVVTSSNFTKDAVSEARDGGVALIDGEQLAFALAAEGVAVERVALSDWRTDLNALRAACHEQTPADDAEDAEDTTEANAS